MAGVFHVGGEGNTAGGCGFEAGVVEEVNRARTRKEVESEEKKEEEEGGEEEMMMMMVRRLRKEEKGEEKREGEKDGFERGGGDEHGCE